MPYIYRSSFLVSVSLSTAEELQQKLGLVSSAIIPSGINLHNFIKTPKSHQPLISYVGRIKKYKNLETLLAAFKKIVTTYPNAQLRIAGEGDYLPVLNKYAMSHNLYNHVKFLGKISHQQKVELLGKSWIMVQPSYKEGWGITCIEANACQTPVIASRVSGLIDAVKDDINGYLFEYGDVEDLFEKISNLLADHKKRSQLSQSALLWSKQFSWEEQITKYHTLIKRALTLQSNQTFSRSFNSIYEKI